MRFHQYFSIRRYVLACFIFIISVSLFSQTLKTTGYIQSTMIKTEDNKAFLFGFDRVRVRFAGTLNEKMDYRLQLDFTDSYKEQGNDGSTPAMINYAEIIFKPTQQLRLSVGKLKTPIGMEWNTGPTSLDIVKRGLGQAFIFHFDAGAMLHAQKLTSYGLGFAAGIFNYGPNKSNDLGDPAEGMDYTFANRISLDPTSSFHAEAYFGSALTSIEDQKNVYVYGAGAKLKLIKNVMAKGEFIGRDDPQNSSADGNDYYLQLAYSLKPSLEPVVKFEKLDLTNDAKDQSNVTLGFNVFLNPENKKQSKLLFNYVISDLEGHDAVQVMFQAAF